MANGLKALRWTPATVSWLSLFMMGLVVAGVGLTGTAYMIEFLHERMTDHGLEHNREIANRLRPLVHPQLLRSPAHPSAQLKQVVDLYGSFGYRVFLITEHGKLLADSGSSGELTQNNDNRWLATMSQPLNGSKLTPGPARAIGEDAHPLLIWLDDVGGGTGDGPGILLGVASDQHRINAFLGELHWHIDAVLLGTYVLIGLVGVFAVRAIGRAYERRLEMQLHQRTRELEKAHEDIVLKTRLATIGQTASVLAHEMRNPLASIKLALSGLTHRESLPERTRRRVELVKGEVDRLDSLLSQTLDYARPIQLSRQPVRVDRLLSKVIEQQQPLLDKRGMSIRRVQRGECGMVNLDEEKIHQVILNVLKNAIEASPDGSEILVRSSTRDDGMLAILVANEGTPPSAETLTHAFDLFYTTKPRGSGLGLGLVKRIVEEHGGSVVLNTDPDLGTCLEMQLPGMAT